MTVETWLEWVREEARRTSREDVVPVLEAIARAVAALRAAAWNVSIDEDERVEPGA